MRWVAAVVVVSGCSLNFHGGDDGTGGDDVGAGCDIAAATCTDGVVTLAEYPGESCSMWDPPVAVYTCPGECTIDAMGLCFDPGCAGPAELCRDPPAAPLPAPFVCDASATCSDDFTCGGVDACG